MIEHLKISLFDAPKGSIITHACNAKGVWGSGIAAEFNKRYPLSYKDYKNFCLEYSTGTAKLSQYYIGESHWVAWLITSEDYGPNKDAPELIKINTTLALVDFCQRVYKTHPSDERNQIHIYSNKFNSGLFNVPWRESELILKTVLKKFKRIKWYICDPKGE